MSDLQCAAWCRLQDDIEHEDCNGPVHRIARSLQGGTTLDHIEVYPVSWISFSDKPRDLAVHVDDERGHGFALTANEARQLAAALLASADLLAPSGIQEMSHS